MSLDLSKTATKLLRKLAAKSDDGYIQLKRETGGSVDPVTGVKTDGTPDLLPLNAAVTDMPESLVNDRVLVTDKLVTTDNLVEPQADDKLVIGGVEHQMILINGGGGHAGITQVYRMAARK